MGLAPMAVLTKLQEKGIGSQLVKTGIEICSTQGYDAVVVLGHPEYYPKFGFVPSVKYQIKSIYGSGAEGRLIEGKIRRYKISHSFWQCITRGFRTEKARVLPEYLGGTQLYQRCRLSVTVSRTN
jgi:hypothetical protein